MYKQIEKDYQEKIELPTLQEKKRVLSDIRNFYKPILREEIDDFEKDYQEKKKIKVEQKRIEREKWYNEIGYGVYDASKYQNKFHSQYLEHEKVK